MEKDQKLRLRFFLNPFLSVVVILVLITVFYIKNLNANHWLIHTQDVKIAIQKVFNTLQDAEIGQRGYILTQEKIYLEPYIQAEEAFQKSMASIRNLVKDNPEQFRRLDTIQHLSTLKFNDLEKTINRVKKGDVIGAINIVRSDVGKVYMDELRELADKMNEEENVLLLELHESLNFWRNLIIVIILISLLIIGLSLYYLYKTIKPIFDELTKTKNQLKNVNDNLSETLYDIKKANQEKLNEIELKESVTKDYEQLVTTLRSEIERLSNQ